MKTIQKSFLFFVLIFCCKTFIYAQKKIDSIKFYTNIINNPKEKSDLINGFLFFKEKQIQDELRNKDINVVYDLIYIARAERKIGVLNDSENSAVDALLILDKLDVIKNQEFRISLYNHLGIVSKELAKYSSALNYYKKALEIESSQKGISTILNNIGNVFFEQKKFEEAINYFNKSFKKSLILNDSLNIARAQSNLGRVQSKLNIDNAFNNIINGLEIRKKKNNQQGIITSYLHLSEYYKDRNQKEKAKSYAIKALHIARVSDIVDYKMSSLETVLTLDEDPIIKEFVELNTKSKKKTQNSKNQYAALKYEKGKETKRANENELKLKDSELKNEKQKQLNLLYLSIVGFIVLSSVFLYFILKSKHKKEKLLEVHKTESRISKKVHDEVANDVFQFMTKLQSNSNSNEHLIDDLEHIYNKTRDISKEHSILDLEGDFESVLNDLIVSYNSVNTNVMVKGISKINWESIPEIKRTTIYKVLQELLINMKKHSKASVVVLTCNTNRKKIEIIYSDNGDGCELKKGTGLQNVENRITSINGTITFESETNNGFKVKLTV